MLSNMSVYPLELVRTRMAMQGTMAKDNFRQIIRHTLKSEGGMSALYKGGSASVVGIIVYKGVGFTIYEMMKNLNRDSLKNSLNFLQFSSGAVAGLFGQIISYPIEITKRHMQVAGSYASDHPTRSTRRGG